MIGRTPIKLALLLFVHVYVGCVLRGYPPIVPVNIARYALLVSDIALIALYFVASPFSISTRYAASAIGVAWLIAVALGYEPGGFSTSLYWRMWVSVFGATGLLVVIGLYRPQLSFRCRRNQSGLLNAYVRIVFRQLRLCHIATLTAAARAPLQFSLRHIFYACTAIATSLVARRWLLEHLDVFVEYVMPGLVGLAAIRAALARNWFLFKCVTAVLLIGALGEGAWWLLARMHDWSMVSEALIVISSLLVVRSCGYRLAERSGSVASGRSGDLNLTAAL